MNNSLLITHLLIISMLQCVTGKPLNLKQRNRESSINSLNDYYYVHNIKCSSTNCPSPHKCFNNSKSCSCDKRFANYPLFTESSIYCQYKMHSQLSSFLFELILNLGIGHLMAGRTFNGIIKLLVYILPFFRRRPKDPSKSPQVTSHALSFCHCCIISLWWLIDALMFGMNWYKDGNGVPLLEW